MKKLRSILAILMVAAMLLSFGAVAFADDEAIEEEAIEVVEEPAADGAAEAPVEEPVEAPAADGAAMLVYDPDVNGSLVDFVKWLYNDDLHQDKADDLNNGGHWHLYYLGTSVNIADSYPGGETAFRTTFTNLTGDAAAAELRKIMNCTSGDIQAQLITKPAVTDGNPTYTYYVIQEEDILDELGHEEYISAIDSNDCTKGGSVTYSCRYCGEVVRTEQRDPIGHSWVADSYPIKEATCTETGIQGFTCSVCGATKTEVISKIDHDYALLVTALPHCVEDSAWNQGQHDVAVEPSFTDYTVAVGCLNCGALYTNQGNTITGDFDKLPVADATVFQKNGQDGYQIKYGTNTDIGRNRTRVEGEYYLLLADRTIKGLDDIKAYAEANAHVGPVERELIVEGDCHKSNSYRMFCAYCQYDAVITEEDGANHGFTFDVFGNPVKTDPDDEHLFIDNDTAIEVEDSTTGDTYYTYLLPVGDRGDLILMGNDYVDCYNMTQTWLCTDCLEHDFQGRWIIVDKAMFDAWWSDWKDSSYTSEEAAANDLLDALRDDYHYSYDEIKNILPFQFFQEGNWTAEAENHSFVDLSELSVKYGATGYRFTLADLIDGSYLDLYELLLKEGVVDDLDEFVKTLVYQTEYTDSVAAEEAGFTGMDIVEAVLPGIDVLPGIEELNNSYIRNCEVPGFILQKCLCYDGDASKTVYEKNSDGYYYPNSKIHGVLEFLGVDDNGNSVFDSIEAAEEALAVSPVGGDPNAEPEVPENTVIVLFNGESYELLKYVITEAADEPAAGGPGGPGGPGGAPGGDESGGQWVSDVYSYRLTNLPAPGHQFGKWYQTHEAVDGNVLNTWVRTCKVCGTWQRKIAAGQPCTSANMEHTAGEWVTELEPTCTEVGLKVQYCETCDAVLDTAEIPATGHSFTNFVVDVDATCTEAGSATAVCDNCGDATATRVLAALGHDWTEWETIEPDCEWGGWDYRYCTRCDEYEEANETEALGHDLGEPEVIQEQSCTDSEYVACYCSRCDYFELEETKQPLGHDWNSGEVVDPAYCGNGGHDGKILYTCGRCGALKTEVDPAPEHQPIIGGGYPATAKEDGLTDGSVCSVCGETLVPQQVIKHNVYKIDASDVSSTGSSIEGTVKLNKKSGDVAEGKLYARFVTNFLRDDGTTYSLAVAYPVVDGEVEVPSYDTADTITDVYVIILNARNSSAAWAQDAVDVDGRSATQIL